MRSIRLSALMLMVPMIMSCQSNIIDSFPGEEFFREATEVKFTDVKQEQYADLDLEAQNRVFREAEAFEEFWKEAYASRTPVPEVPEIDFTQQMVVASVMGSRPNGGYGIHINKIASGEEALGVHVVKSESGEDCYTTLGMTNPLHIVKLSSADKYVEFFEEKVVNKCN